jgi:hypothetical protein
MAIIFEQQDDPMHFPVALHNVTFTDGERPPVIDFEGILHFDIDWETQDAPVATGYMMRRNHTRGILVPGATIIADRWSTSPQGLTLWFHFNWL